jgi:hypothetical protein
LPEVPEQAFRRSSQPLHIARFYPVRRKSRPGDF